MIGWPVCSFRPSSSKRRKSSRGWAWCHAPPLGTVPRSPDRHGASLLVDAYHHLNVVPFDIHAMGLETAFVTGGGYKYCQLGEGNAFLRLPEKCRLRPVITGWFSEFAALEEQPAAG